MSVCPHRNAKGACQSKVRKFQVVILVNEKILWLKITVEDAMGMAVEET
jgi:hypothetical protein